MPLQTQPCNAFERHVFLLLVLNFVVAGVVLLLFFFGGGRRGSSQTLINENKVKQEDCDSD